MVEIHSGAKDAMAKHLESALGHSVVEGGNVRGADGFWEPIRLFSNIARKKCEPWLRDRDARMIFYDHASSAIEEIEPDYEARKTLNGILTDLLGARGLSKLVSAIIGYLESLPRTYDFSFSLPRCTVSEGCPTAQISDSVFLKTERTNAKSGLLIVAGRNFRRAIRIEVKGYANYDIGTSASQKALAALKRVCYLAALSDDLDRGDSQLWSLFSGDDQSQGEYSVADREYGANSTTHSLPITMTRGLQQLSFPSAGLEKSILLSRLSETENMTKIVEPIYDDDPSIASIQLATEWAFDGSATDDDRLALLQFSVAFEALLGEGLKFNDPITVALADRCAYLIGKNATMRQKIRADFRKFYQARSNIIHGKHSFLSDEDLNCLSWADLVLGMCLKKEIANI